MNDHVDEEIGALLDGRLEPRRRDELLARLATDGDDYDVFADTAAVLREAEEGEKAGKDHPVAAPRDEPHRPADVIPLRPRRASGWQSPGLRVLAAAAVLATLALIPVLRSRANAWRDPSRLAALAMQPGESLPADWGPASVNRGPGDAGENTVIAAQVGALHVDLVVSAAAGDTARVSRFAARAEWLLDNVTLGGTVADHYGELKASSTVSGRELLRRLAEAHTAAADIIDPDYFALGAWTEAARLAARRRDSAFFAARESRTALERAASLEELGADTKAAVARLRTIRNQGAVNNWARVEDDLNLLQRRLEA